MWYATTALRHACVAPTRNLRFPLHISESVTDAFRYTFSVCDGTVASGVTRAARHAESNGRRSLRSCDMGCNGPFRYTFPLLFSRSVTETFRYTSRESDGDVATCVPDTVRCARATGFAPLQLRLLLHLSWEKCNGNFPLHFWKCNGSSATGVTDTARYGKVTGSSVTPPGRGV